MQCPCGSEQQFLACCKPLIERVKTPKTAEQLMRSRYSAYATGAFEYILDTYTKAQRDKLRLNDISESTEDQKWVKLIIHHSEELAKPITVEFSAYYVIGTELFELRENSRFIKEDNQFLYSDGDILVNDKLATLKRNDQCPCNSGKKFKKCCAS